MKVNVGYPAIFPFHKFGIELKEIGLEDHPAYEINEQEELKPCLDFIHQGVLNNTGTLVICTAGMSRSATICIAYLMKHQGHSFQSGFDLTKKARHYVNPN